VVALARLLILRSPFFVPIAAYPIVFPLVYYLTQTSLRLRHPCDPVLALMAALALPIFPLKAAPSIGPERVRRVPSRWTSGPSLLK
jgi:hypothetical protein